MNVCVACRDVTPHAASGLVRATCDLVQTLAEEGHEVHLLTDRSSSPPPNIRRVAVERLTVPVASGVFRAAAPETAAHNLMHAAAVYREVRRIHECERPVDAVLAPLWRSEGAIAQLDERFPTIVSCMTSLRTLVEVDSSYLELADLEERLALERQALARSRYLHGLTYAALSKTIDDFGLAPDATAVIGRGLRDRRIDGYGRAEVPRLLFVGRIERRKGVDTLIEAAARLIDDGLPFALTLAGPLADASIREQFQRAAGTRPRLEQAVTFVGQVPDPELARLYAEADIVCAPSRYESHGVVLVEAMMFGKAIITCDSGGVSEVVDAGRNALVAPPDDAAALAELLKRLAEDPGLRAELGRSARDTYERRFAPTAVADQMQSFLEEVRAIHTPSPGGVGERVQQLLHDVFSVSEVRAAAAATELLDPEQGEPLRRLRAAAGNTPAPRSQSSDGPCRITAAVLTHDRSDLLDRALRSLDESAAAANVIVLDNGSTQPNARRVEAICAARAGVRFERSEENLGTAGGRSLLLGRVDTDLVLFLDDDAELIGGALDHLLAELDAHPEAGAVTATVVSSDGVVTHSGGSFTRGDEIVTFRLIGAGAEFGEESVPPSGPAGWVPGTAVLARRDLLRRFPLDPKMAAYFEDNEWCYRVSLENPGCFRRSREALVLHHQAAPSGASLTKARRFQFLAALSRFYERHQVLLEPWTFGDVLPELRAVDGACDIRSAKLLMELQAAKGEDWMLAAFDSGELDGLLGAQHTRAELERLKKTIAAREETILRLAETLERTYSGGWWKLRDRLLPLLRLVTAVRAALPGGRERPFS